MSTTQEIAPNPQLRILVLSASARTGSLNSRLAESAARVAERAGARVNRANLRDYEVPLYNLDDQQRDGVPEGAERLGEALRSADGFIIASPEYNYSMPGNLKNLIDWVSRIKPWPFTGVHGLLLSASPGGFGGYRGLSSLRVPLEALGSRMYPEMFALAGAGEHSFGGESELTDPDTARRLSTTVSGFLDATEAAVHYPRLRALAA